MKKYFFSSLLLGIILSVIILSAPLIASILTMFGNQASIKNPQLARTYYDFAHYFTYGPRQTETLQYDESRIDYQEKKYNQSMKTLQNLSDKSLTFEAKHNLGNSLYRLGQNTKNPNETLKYWKEALTAYSGALLIRKDSEAQANYDFVAEKIKQFQGQQKTQEENTKQQESQKNGSGSENKSGGGSEDKQNQSGSGAQAEKTSSGSTATGATSQQESGGSGSNTPGTWTNKGNFNSVGSGNQEQSALTPAQEKQLEEYLQGLKQSEKENRQFFQNQATPITQNGISDMIQNFFGNDPFFSNNLDGSGKKDW